MISELKNDGLKTNYRIKRYAAKMIPNRKKTSFIPQMII